LVRDTRKTTTTCFQRSCSVEAPRAILVPVTRTPDPIFDPFERTDPAPAWHTEPTYTFLNRIAGDFWEQPRQLIQQWANRLPADDYDELRARMRSRDDEQFRSAFLELYLHESLLRAGFNVTIHPKLSGTTRRPDFYAVRGHDRFYLEAIAPGASQGAKAAAARRNVLFDTVDRLGNPNFLLWLDELDEGPRPPASSRLRSALRQWLALLDPDDYDDLEHAPTLEWSHDGWRALFRAIPIRPDARGHRPGARSIGVYAQGGVSWIDDAPGIRAALTNKHHAYGELDAPFVVAVGTYIHDTDRWHTTNAMYGQQAIQWWKEPDGETRTRTIRQPDGYFGAPPQWRNRQVSAVLLLNQLQPYTLLRAESTLWLHPNPLHSIETPIGLAAPAVRLTGGQLESTDPPQLAHELFQLPADWPAGDPFPKQ
jgi:hypothetical protein